VKKNTATMSTEIARREGFLSLMVMEILVLLLLVAGWLVGVHFILDGR
jgi:hypothetical protein